MPMADDAEEESVVIDLELLKSNLRVSVGELQRLNARNNFLLRLPLTQILRIGLRRRFDFMTINLVFVGVALAAIGAYVSASNLTTCVLYTLAVFAMAIGFFGMRFPTVQLVIRTSDGVLRVQCQDPPDEVECFLVSLRMLIPKTDVGAMDQGQTATESA
jgi:hypothetical protein